MSNKHGLRPVFVAFQQIPYIRNRRCRIFYAQCLMIIKLADVNNNACFL